MEQRLNRMEEKLDRVLEIQASMQADVREHIRRTEIAEDNIDKLATAIQPIQHHVAVVNSMGTIATILAAVAGAVAGIWQLVR